MAQKTLTSPPDDPAEVLYEGKRPRGRPRVDPNDSSNSFTLTLASKDFAAYCQRARREGVSVAEMVRRDLDKKKTNK